MLRAAYLHLLRHSYLPRAAVSARSQGETQLDVDVIIRTAGRRRAALARATGSVLNQRGVEARPIVIANHPRLGPRLPLALESRVKLHRVSHKVSPGAALGVGRSLVTAPFFAFLDDDDELLSAALAAGVEIMRENAEVDAVITTGYRIASGQRRIDIPDIAREQRDPLSGIIERCWLNPGGALFRTAAVSQSYFDGLPDLCEWTFLAFRLAFDARNIRFLDQPTYLAYDTPGSLSKTAEYVDAIASVLDTMRGFPLPQDLRAKLERKYRGALHEAAECALKQGQHIKAWRFHLRSMRPPYLLRYFAYTRKLLWPGRRDG